MSNLYPNLTPGTLLGNYRIEAPIGAGGMGVVFRATSPDGRAIAVKVLRPELADNPTVRERLRREAGALRRVQGGRTARVFEVDADHNPPYLVMELVAGQPLDTHISQNGHLSGMLLKSFAQGICEAVADIHAAGIVHRDLKPSNVMIGPDGVKVLDFGVSVLEEAATLTKTGVFVGTTSWLSPEQVQGHTVATASDVFNLGLLLVYAATGEHAFGEGRPDAVMYRVVHDEPNLGGMSGSLREIARSCMQKSPSLRPSVAALRDLLTTQSDSPAHTGTPTTATRISSEISAPPNWAGSPPLPSPNNKASRKPIAAVLAVAAALLVVGGVVVYQRGKNTEAPTLSSPTTTELEDGVAEETTDAIDLSADLVSAFRSEFNDVFVDILKSSYQVPTLERASDSNTTAMNNAWGVQMDCDGFYPLRELLPFWRSARPVFSQSYSNFLGDNKEYPNKYIVSELNISVFYTPGQLDNFKDSAEYLADVLEDCQDEDFFLPYEEVPEVATCITKTFPNGQWAEFVVDDVCARRINQQVAWDTEATNDKSAYVLEETVHNRPGYAVAFSSTSNERGQEDLASSASQSVHVWVEEGFSMVVTAYGSNASYLYPNDFESISNRIFDYRLAAEDAVNEVLSKFVR
jgi:tRNA A-37 threonylcarbamoyl transferase component Bud32